MRYDFGRSTHPLLAARAGRCYMTVMADTHDLDIDAAPSALPPGEHELAAWNALARDEQVRRYRDYLAHPDCHSFTDDTPDDILEAARAKVAARRLG